MSAQTLANCSIEELERLFDEKRESKEFLLTLHGELLCRKTKRARELKSRIVQRLGIVKSE